ncbi:hypothetical protein BN946_scf184829.g27 [Trametes cinnabarina]|uniref:Acyl-protein thioesterase 1 n=1 Tax=Pycnoporus cinnabarinus TaxID=5643 RepID=A0A060SFA2_PYCCI|nr:hypothetical protein BN946_scf184829.g27 [Trametes cinnabarina]
MASSAQAPNLNESNERPIVISPRETHNATVIFMHGLGQRAEYWVTILQRVVDRLQGIKWILPQAPAGPLGSSYQWRGLDAGRPSWFDITELPPCNCHDEAGIASSVATIENLLTREVRGGTEPNRIIVAGFGQGAALSLVTALTTLHELGGVASLSGWIPQPTRQVSSAILLSPGVFNSSFVITEQAMLQLEPSLPVFWAHGLADVEVPLSYAEDGTAFLRDGLNIPESNIVFKTYDGLQHDINDTELDDFAAWLLHTLA